MKWQYIRQLVLKRDNHKCRYIQCNSTNRLHVHHIIPIIKGGTDHLSNLISLCGKHHRSSEPLKRKDMVTTTVQVDITTRDKLNAIGKRRESYDDIINRLMKKQ